MLPKNVTELASKSIEVGSRLSRQAAPLVTRLVIGTGFIQTGLGKWRNLDATTAFFDNVGIPLPGVNAVFIATLELVGGALLALGLLTRTFALLLVSTMVVALLTADRGTFLGAVTGSGSRTLTDIAAVVFLMLLLWIAGFGGGAVSVDAFLARKRQGAGMVCKLANA